MIQPDALVRFLRRATLLFLAGPLALFFAGWLRWPLTLVLCGALGAAVRQEWAQHDDKIENPEASSAGGLSWRWLFLGVALPAAAWTALSGAGGWGAGDSDWLKHDTLLRDLLMRPWPVTYESGQGPVLLVYYVTFYLPAALLGKLAGGSWTVASQTLALTTFAGLVLAAGWAVALAATVNRPRNPAQAHTTRWTLSRRGAAAALAVFFGFSGLDVLGKMTVNRSLGLPVFYGDWSDIEWWAQFAQYSSNAATVFWAPQHAFGGWLTTALALDDLFRRRGLERRGALYVALALAWSPFAAVGLLPMVGAMMLWRGCELVGQWTSYAPLGHMRWWIFRLGRRRGTWRNFLTVENGAGALAGGMFALFLAAHFQAYPLPVQYKVTPGFHPMLLLREIRFGWLYLLFVGVEFAGFGPACWLFFRPGKSPLSARWRELPEAAPPLHIWQVGQAFERYRLERVLLWPALLVLFALPWFRYGYANDLVMRGGIPALFTLQVLVARLFARAADGPLAGRQRVAVALASVLFIGGLANTFLEYRRHVVKIVAQGSWRDARTREPVCSLAQLHRTIYARPGFDFARQYLGSVDSPFARYAAARRGALKPGATTHTPPDF